MTESSFCPNCTRIVDESGIKCTICGKLKKKQISTNLAVMEGHVLTNAYQLGRVHIPYN